MFTNNGSHAVAKKAIATVALGAAMVGGGVGTAVAAPAASTAAASSALVQDTDPKITCDHFHDYAKTAKSAAVYWKASSKSRKLATVPAGTEVYTCGLKSNGYTAVYYTKGSSVIIGWTANSNLKSSSSELSTTGTSGGLSSGSISYGACRYTVKIRKSASTSATVLGRLVKGQTLETPINVKNKGDWMYITSPQKGWINYVAGECYID